MIASHGLHQTHSRPSSQMPGPKNRNYLNDRNWDASRMVFWEHPKSAEKLGKSCCFLFFIILVHHPSHQDDDNSNQDVHPKLGPSSHASHKPELVGPCAIVHPGPPASWSRKNRSALKAGTNVKNRNYLNDRNWDASRMVFWDHPKSAEHFRKSCFFHHPSASSQSLG